MAKKKLQAIDGGLVVRVDKGPSKTAGGVDEQQLSPIAAGNLVIFDPRHALLFEFEGEVLLHIDRKHVLAVVG